MAKVVGLVWLEGLVGLAELARLVGSSWCMARANRNMPLKQAAVDNGQL